MKSSNKRKGGKCQVILRKSLQWCNWDEEEEKSEEEEKEMKKEEKRGKKSLGRNSGKGRATDDKFK